MTVVIIVNLQFMNSNKYAPFFIVIISFVLFFSSTSFKSNPNIKRNTISLTQDTIEFVVNRDFTGQCQEYCFQYIESDINKINNVSPSKNTCYNLFVKCPSAIRLRKGKTYKFIANSMNLSTCSSPIDTCKNNHFLYLEREVN